MKKLIARVIVAYFLSCFFFALPFCYALIDGWFGFWFGVGSELVLIVLAMLVAWAFNTLLK